MSCCRTHSWSHESARSRVRHLGVQAFAVLISIGFGAVVLAPTPTMAAKDRGDEAALRTRGFGVVERAREVDRKPRTFAAKAGFGSARPVEALRTVDPEGLTVPRMGSGEPCITTKTRVPRIHAPSGWTDATGQWWEPSTGSRAKE